MTTLLMFLGLIVIGVPAILFLLGLVHVTLDRLCAIHARSFCAKSGLSVSRVRLQPAFDQSGVKTEFTLAQLDCLDAQQHRRLVLVLVWPLGVRKLRSDENYPDSYDEKWPLKMAP
jgi:hypothetical protein